MNKDNRWFNSNDPGILRKKDDKDEELLVIGYGCKLFRDDQKALELDQGKQLIPWMGLESLKIDRYDARGHLSETCQFTGSSQDYVPTSYEREIERACDEERYRSLNHNEEEQLMYQEEEFKRLKHAASNKEYGQVQYQYSEDGPSTSSLELPEAPSTQPPEELEPFVLNPLLVDDIPNNMILPTTKKENQIIEKTATYMALHGSQVEIMVKTREARNEKLGFMHAGSPLNPYYNFIVEKIKSGRYKPGEEPATNITTQPEIEPSGGDYLHPLLAASTTIESAPSIPSIAYKSSGDSAYDMLVKNIRNVQQNQELAVEKAKPASSTKTTKPYEDLSSSSRRRWKRRNDDAISDVLIGPSLPSDHIGERIPPKNVREIISKLIIFAQSMGLHPSEIATNVLTKSKKSMDFLRPGHLYYEYYIKEIEKSYKGNTKKSSSATATAANGQSSAANGTGDEYDPEAPTEELEESAVDVKYDPECHTEVEVEVASVKDKTTSQSPQLLRKKGGSRRDSRAANGVRAASSDHSIRPAPVSFSIKKPKEEKLEIPSALPIEESSSSEDENREGAEKKSDDGENQKTESKQNQKPKTDTKEEPKNSSTEERGKEKQAKTVRETQSPKEKAIVKKQDSPSKEISVAAPVNGFHSTQGNGEHTKKASPTKEKRINGSSSSLPSTSKDSPKRRKKDPKIYKDDKDNKGDKPSATLVTAGKREKVTVGVKERKIEPEPEFVLLPPLPQEPAPATPPPPPPLVTPTPPPTTPPMPLTIPATLIELETDIAKKRERKMKAKALLEKMKLEGSVPLVSSSDTKTRTALDSTTLSTPSPLSIPSTSKSAGSTLKTPLTSKAVDKDVDEKGEKNKMLQVRESLKKYIEDIVKEELPSQLEGGARSSQKGTANKSDKPAASTALPRLPGSALTSGNTTLKGSSSGPSNAQKRNRDSSEDDDKIIATYHKVNKAKKTKHSTSEHKKKSRKRSKKHSHSESRERRKRRKKRSRSVSGSSSTTSSESSDDENSSLSDNVRPSTKRCHKSRRHSSRSRNRHHKKSRKHSKSKKSKRPRYRLVPTKRRSASSSSSD